MVGPINTMNFGFFYEFTGFGTGKFLVKVSNYLREMDFHFLSSSFSNLNLIFRKEIWR